MPKINLTPKFLDHLRPAPAGQRKDYMDAIVPGMGVRVTDKANGKYAAQKTFILVARFSKGKSPTRRALGSYGELTLEKAREKARDWLELIAKGVDPAAEIERERRAAAEEREADARSHAKRESLTVRAALAEYIERHVAKTRKAADVTREINKEIIPAWGDRLVSEITEDDVVALVRTIADRGAVYQAHNVFGHVRTFYSWLIGTGGRKRYGFMVAPTYGLRPGVIIGRKAPRQRVLSANGDEIAAYWRAAKRMPYPTGPFLRLLILTACRKNEVAGARWSEFHPELVRLLREHDGKKPIDWRTVPAEWKTWTIPPERFKSGAEHLVPLTDDALAVLAAIPHFKRGDFLFSTTFGAKPINGFSKAKARLDARMLRTLRAMARKRGSDASAVTLRPFVLHDVRRTVRTQLSSLKVPGEVAEMVIGHGKKGLARVYDQHQYLPEMRDALENWAARLREITTPAPVNVVKISKRRARHAG